MSGWRAPVLGFGAMIPLAALGAAHTSIWLVAPPLVAAALVLFVAAISVDYFGVARKRESWGGFGEDQKSAWKRARKLERRFHRQKEGGSPHASWTARSLLLALSQCDRLDEAAEVVDFMTADSIHIRVGADPTADALRAVAMAHLGRAKNARDLCAALDKDNRRRGLAVVSYAVARVAELDSRPRSALLRVDEALTDEALQPTAKRDLLMLRARVLAALCRIEDSADVLSDLVTRGFRREVELLAERSHARGDASTAVAARNALCEAIPYR